MHKIGFHMLQKVRNNSFYSYYWELLGFPGHMHYFQEITSLLPAGKHLQSSIELGQVTLMKSTVKRMCDQNLNND